MIASPDKPIDGLSLLRRFLDKVEAAQCADEDWTGDCWVWTGAINSKKYPVIRVGGRILLAHRVSHELFVGPIPDGEQVHHKCCTPRCVNPEHLQSVTPELNRWAQAMGTGEIPI